MRILVQVILIATIAGITALEVEKVDNDEENKCANAKMDICNKKVKKAFLQGGRKGLSTRDIYCSSMKDLSKCVESQLQSGNLCNSNKLRKYHFVVMSYLQMDKLMSVCKENVKDDFKEKVMAQFLLIPEFKDFEEFRTLAFDEEPADVDECAKTSHNKCVTQFTGLEQEDQDNLCDGVSHFIQCYQENKCPTNRLSVSFAHFIKQMSTELIEAFKTHSMCKLDNAEL